MKEGDRFVLTPVRFGKRGEAEAEHEGKRIRVAGGIPGEKARVEVTHVSQGGPVAVARYLGPAATPHPARRTPPCPIHDTCGGCGLQQIEETEALALKVQQARRLFSGAEWRDAITSRPFGYRAKAFLLPQRRGPRLIFGARPPRGGELVDTSGCAVLRPELEELAERVRGVAGGRAAMEERLRSVMLRANRAGEVQATFVHRGDAGEIVDVAREVGADAAFVQRHDEPGNLIFSQTAETLVAGAGPIEERFFDVSVEIPPTAFCQGNPEVAERLYDAAATALDGERIGELYCGAGAAGLLALTRHEKATLHGVDRSPRAVAAAEANARRNGLAERARFLAALAEEAAADWDVVLVNPPRAGCHEAVIDAIANSAARRLVYMSCNPVTLARDAARLGWTPRWVQPADMFPQTVHLELLALFDR